MISIEHAKPVWIILTSPQMKVMFSRDLCPPVQGWVDYCVSRGGVFLFSITRMVKWRLLENNGKTVH